MTPETFDRNQTVSIDGTFGPADPEGAKIPSMSLRDYFAAHAPTERWRHYWPTASTPRPEPDWAGISESAKQFDASPNNWKELAAWDNEQARQYDLQWPYFYADAMLAERSKP